MNNTKQLPGTRTEFPITINETTVLFLGDINTVITDITEESEQLIYQNLHTHAFGELFCGVEDCTKINIAENTSSLSASGSRNFPKSLT